MFERYTGKARRAIFFARYEASQLGATHIEPEHILLGLLREDRLLQMLFRLRTPTLEDIRNQICGNPLASEYLSGSRDMPLSQSAIKVLSLAAQESDNLKDPHIGTEHLLLALIKEKTSVASRILLDHGITVEKILPLFQKPKEQFDRGDDIHGQGVAGGIPGGVIGSITGGIPFPDDFFSRLAEKSGVTQLRTSFDLLLELLIQKGVITEEEKRGIIKPQDS